MTDANVISILYTGITPPDVLEPQNASKNIALEHVPMLESRPIEFDRAHVRELLQKPTAVVFYSQIAVQNIIDQGFLEEIDLKDKYFWAVGHKTAQLLEQELNISVHVPEEENFEGLKVSFESADLPPALLALSLQGVHRDFSDICARRGIAFEDVSVYETRAIGTEQLAKTLQKSSFDWIVFTSPRGVETFFEHLKSIDDMFEKITFSKQSWHMAAIGPSTQKAIEQAGYTAHLTVEAPDRNRIVNAILEL